METIESALKMYRKVVDSSYQKAVEKGVEVVERRGIFSSVLVIWLMIFQRLNSDHSLAAALERLREGDFDELLDGGSLAARSGKISGATGGYSRARSRIRLELVEETVDELYTALNKNHKVHALETGQQVFIVDGSTLLVNFSPQNIAKYPQYKNQHGNSHFPLMRTCIATNAFSGVVLRPSYGPHNGDKACEELGLVEKLFSRIPPKSLVIGDRLFGCCRFASRAEQASHQVIVRLKEVNTKKYIGKPSSLSGEVEAQWNSKRSHRPGDQEEESYSVWGRFIWHTVERKGFRPLKLFLFTNSTLPRLKIVELYGLRWHVESDLRDIKSTLKLDMLYAKSPTMGEKELLLGIAAYNLVRHVIVASAKLLNVTPREFSFSRTLKRIVASSAHAHHPDSANRPGRGIHFILTDAKSLLLPKRIKQKTTEPRKIWRKHKASFFTTKSRESERALLKKTNAGGVL